MASEIINNKEEIDQNPIPPKIPNETDETQKSSEYDPYLYYDIKHPKPSFMRSTISSIVDDAKTLIKTLALGTVTGIGAFKGIQYVFNNLSKEEGMECLKEFVKMYPQFQDKLPEMLSKVGTGTFIGSLIAYGGYTLVKSLWNYFTYKYRYNSERENHKNMMQNTETTFRNYYDVPDEKERLIQ